MLEMVIAFIVGIACGRALDWYQNSRLGQEKKAEPETVEEEISVTEVKSE